MAQKLKRNGVTYIDEGKSLLYDPMKQTFKGLYLLQLEGKPLRVRPEVRSKLSYYKGDNPVEFKALAEKIVIELVAYLVKANGNQAVELSQVYQEGAYLVGVSSETVKRYVFAHTARAAPLRRVGKKVELNPYFRPEGQDDDEEVEE